jgi:16S rRNA G1207 methylase RsmC
MNNLLEKWMRAATTAERQALADACATSYDYVVYHLAKGRREPDALLAAKIETATKLLARGTNGRLFTVYRTELNSACRACAFAARCLGDAAIASEFPLVE